MKNILIMAYVSIFTISCAAIRVSRVVSIENMMKMQPFDAVVEDVNISHPFFISTTIDIDIQKTDDGKRLDIYFDKPTKAAIDLAKSLSVGHRYTFPQVFNDYYTNFTMTNTPAKP